MAVEWPWWLELVFYRQDSFGVDYLLTTECWGCFRIVGAKLELRTILI